jgi:hypothetical protein
MATVTPTVVPYVQLTCNPTIKRTAPTDSTAVLTFNGAMFVGSFGAYSNALTIDYRYKLTTASSYGSWTSVAASSITYGTNSYRNNGSVSLGSSFDYQQSYDIQVRVTDGANGTTLSTVTKTVQLQKGIPVFDWGEDDFNINVSAKGKVYGLAAGRSMIPSGADLDDYTEPGIYGVTSAAIAREIANCPHIPGGQAYAGTLRVWVGRGNNKQYGDTYSGISQEYTDMQGNTFRRMGDADGSSPPTFTWGKWRQFVSYQSEDALSPSVTVTYDTTTFSGHSISVRYFPQLGMCFVRGYAALDHKALSAGSYITVATIPADYRPASITALAASGLGLPNVRLTSKTSTTPGAFQVLYGSAMSANYSYDIYFSGWWAVS